MDCQLYFIVEGNGKIKDCILYIILEDNRKETSRLGH